ncbi:Abi-alpha family protein, partial [Nocardioides sp. GCM10030258]|uniref:Abi-alpha family protein n=1 Tax=unclassified Nocardioides TaxID=2615069 RepID=UPI0036091E01
MTRPPLGPILDPFGLWGPTTRAVVVTGRQVVGWTERQLLGALRSRLDIAAPPRQPRELAAGTESRGGTPLRGKMDRLLDRALEQNSQAGRQELFHKIIDQLVPDEARIVGALSDGSASPMVHVYARTISGIGGEPILENASLVGKMANVSLPHMTPVYVSHLLSLGVVETGPEDPRLKNDYQILGADAAVLRALKAGKRGPM